MFLMSMLMIISISYLTKLLISSLRFDKFIIAELDSNASGFNEINENNYKKIINA